MRIYPLSINVTDADPAQVRLFFERPSGETATSSEIVSPWILQGLLSQDTIKNIRTTDRMDISISVTGSGVGLIDRMTHILLVDDDDRGLIYRVVGYDTLTLSSRSLSVSLELDALATASLYHRGAFSIRGTWDVWLDDIACRALPFDVPLVIDQERSIRLPHTEIACKCWDFQSQQAVDGVIQIGYVYITGVKDGDFACDCIPVVLNSKYPAALSRLASDNTRYYTPRLSVILDNPQKYSEFETTESIISVSISARAPQPATVSVYQEPTSSAPETSLNIDMPYAWIKVGDAGNQKLAFRLPTVGSSSYKITPLTVPDFGVGTDPRWSMCTFEIRDMIGSMVGDLDTRLRHMQTPRRFTGLKVETVTTLTGVETRLIMPDGSMIKWMEGQLPFNTSRHLDYLATQATYDRELMDMSNQRAMTDYMLNSANSITNGLISGGLTANPIVGVASAALGIVTQGIKLESDIDLAEKELQAKVDQIKLMPDNTFTSASEIYIRNANRIADGEGLPLDSIIVRRPMDMAQNWNQTDKYLEMCRSGGLLTSGDYAELSVNVLETGRSSPMVRIRQCQGWNINDAAGTPCPQWLMDRVLSELKSGYRIKRMR